MSTTRRPLSLKPPVRFGSIAFDSPKPARFTVPAKARRDPAGGPRKIPIEHLPSPRSPILFKIVAMETYAGNTARLNRRRQFFNRFRST
jgi:hypothetical protein